MNYCIWLLKKNQSERIQIFSKSTKDAWRVYCICSFTVIKNFYKLRPDRPGILSESCKTGSDDRQLKTLSESCEPGSDVRQLKTLWESCKTESDVRQVKILSESCKTGNNVRQVKILSESCKTGSDVRQVKIMSERQSDSHKNKLCHTDLEVLPGMTTDDITDFRQDDTLLPPRLQVREETLWACANLQRRHLE